MDLLKLCKLSEFEDLFYGSFASKYIEAFEKSTHLKFELVEKQSKIEYDDSYGEQTTENITWVFKLNDKHFMLKGTEDSWSGLTLDKSLVEVKPVEKTITVWEQV